MSMPGTFELGMQYCHQGVIFEVVHRRTDGTLTVRNLVTQEENALQVHDLLEQWIEGKLEFVLTERIVQPQIVRNNQVADQQIFPLDADISKRHPNSTTKEGMHEKDTIENTAIDEPSHERVTTIKVKSVQVDLKANEQLHDAPFPHHPNQSLLLKRITLDLFVVDQEQQLPLGQPTIVSLQDSLTNYPSGFSLNFGGYTAATDMDCILHAILPKNDVKQLFQTGHDYLAYGLPRFIEGECTKAFSADVEIACAKLGRKHNWRCS